MFATTARARQQQRRAYQRESSPPPLSAQDSCYGVRSMSSDWGVGSVAVAVADDELAGSRPRPAAEDVDMHMDMESDGGEGDQAQEQGDFVTGEDIEPGEADPEVEAETVGLGITPTAQTTSHWPHMPSMQTRDVIERADISNSNTAVGPSDSHHQFHAETQTRTRIIPPSPEDTVHPLEADADAERSGGGGEAGSPPVSSSRYYQAHAGGHSLSHLNYVDSHFVPTSEPSSPASFTSMPSYVASLSSLSRTSSVSASPLDDHPHSHHHRHGDRYAGDAGEYVYKYGYAEPGDTAAHEDLVLPTLSLPSESLSLHMSLKQWATDKDTHGVQKGVEGLKVVLIGEREIAEKALKGLKKRCELVELGRGVVGVVKGDKVVLRVLTGLSVDQVKAYVNRAYHFLDQILHPDPPRSLEVQAEMRRLVAGHAGRSDWVHQVIALDNSESADHTVDALGKLVPTIKVHLSLDRDEAASSDDKYSPPFALSREIEPTPRPADEATGIGYFAPREYTPSPSSSRNGSPAELPDADQSISYGACEALFELVNDGHRVAETSAAAFLAWRSTCASSQHQVEGEKEEYLAMRADANPKAMTQSMTSNSAASSSSYGLGGVGPMPTVARAQGGGEWEATLSRRMAQRREDGHVGAGAGTVAEVAKESTLRPPRGNRGRQFTSGGRGRRSSEREREKEKRCIPLFPPSRADAKDKEASKSSISTLGLGIGELVSKTFTMLNGWKARGGSWRGVVLACAVVVAVGWGCWISGR